MSSGLDDAVYGLVRRVPRGSVISYGVLGRLLRPALGPRRVGLAMSRCPAGIPWHRVVAAGGRLADLPSLGGKELQKNLLEREGVLFSASGRVREEFLVRALRPARPGSGRRLRNR